MQSSVHRYWSVLLGSVVLATACSGGGDGECAWPVSDFPFCDSGGAGSPALGGGSAGEDAGGTSGGAPPMGSATAGTTGGDSEQNGGATAGGTTGTTGGDLGEEFGGDAGVTDCVTGCFGLTGDGGADAGGEPGDCGEPLECDREVELDAGGVVKTLSGDPPLELTHVSFEWGAGDSQHLTVFLRGVDAAGEEVRLRAHLDEAAYAQARQDAATVTATVVACGQAEPEPMEVTVSGGAGWSLGFSGKVTVAGEGWSSQLTFVASPTCEVF